MRHSLEEKLSVVRDVLSGKGLKPTCRARHVDRHLVRDWLVSYEEYGEAGLSGCVRQRLSWEKKVELYLAHMKKGLTLRQLGRHYGIGRSGVISCIRQVRRCFAPGVKPFTVMARPRKREPQTELERLQYENLRLRAENALLKKVKALMEEEESRLRAIGRKPSSH